MSSASPPRLLDIAIQSVLQDEASAIDALEWLPVDLFRPLFTAAFQGGHRETVKAMVFSWPFTYLRLGVLMEDCESLYDMLKAALDGLEMLLALKDRPKRCKLKQLDLRLNSGTEIWNTWLATQSDGSLTSSEEPAATQPSTQTPKEGRSRSEEKHQLLPPVRVLIDLCFQEEVMDEFLTLLSEIIKQGKALPPLYCRKVEFVGDVPKFSILEDILEMVRLDSVWDVEVRGPWDLHDLNWFGSYLARMVHLHTISFSGIVLDCLGLCMQKGVKKLLAEFSTHFLCLHEVECLILDGVFLHGHLHWLLKCLQTPLKYLTIKDCMLVDSDLTCLSCCPCTSHLQSLDLSGVFCKGIHFGLLADLLERLSATLTNLDLDSCGIKDSEFMALKPALGHCTQLKYLAFSGNPVSSGVLLALMYHTMPRCQFSFLELPVPPRCYVGPEDTLDEGSLEQVMEDLTLTLPPSRPHSISFLSYHSRNGSDAIIIDFKS
ncbi:melanoma antigen preferentially expressed in tumors-like [Echinops telfairi]|uniref:Melanoma antigen preferentially expressed in tumors-like n=3 Tax=Echinops telfairi TaxID=9371 RepID=A0AC55D4R5_ECHTE|nr:melanoma antigen preferentially expressed in tumors-like [Echinops telfairi]XP_045146712.1 melanoma antigen preferentially expressed in tumors-like [Echinops telfairi]XP_045146713.1 melanoma antigen preferentially expressed in tumors-like [Echinops telfairi]